MQGHTQKTVASDFAVAEAVVSESYREYHDVSYDEFCSIGSQLADTCNNLNGSVIRAGFVDVVKLAAVMATYAARVADEEVLPLIPSE